MNNGDVLIESDLKSNFVNNPYQIPIDKVYTMFHSRIV